MGLKAALAPTAIAADPVRVWPVTGATVAAADPRFTIWRESE
jgi:hypothetical protein